ncbi:hypothetical protein FDP41_012945 [Naegleria fowleri]|uniref:non-specific serine/threonine protein kinase n=1 Tax=Naegleria fowleri TaxID=5763 RepID=A0A6A5BVC1_NAEFO|nr:uncharacterized protein FDP41_012945 [Naegleria fowleri]KAF0981157.1 hypothetical protein FDP41_012945 [Naegleria fowleri]CAG4717142.1 unnamed protein product [Naegleria fowleri]
MGNSSASRSENSIAKFLMREEDDDEAYERPQSGSTTTTTTNSPNGNAPPSKAGKPLRSPKVGDPFVDLGVMLSIDSIYHGYQITSLIGKGSYGEVYLVKKGNANYALKVLELPKTTDREAVEAIDKEIKILKNLKHPNIMQFIEEFPLKDQMDKSCVGVVTEYCQKGTIGDIIEKDLHVNINIWRVLAWFTQLCSALKYCHEEGIIHRDIKPSNMLIGEDDTLRLCDFGLAKMLNSKGAVTYTICGTPLYVAPEIALQRPYAFSCDIYSMGLCVFELTCQQQHDLFYRAVLREREKIPGMFEKIKLASLKDLIRKMVEPDPDLRISAANLFKHPYVRCYRYLTLNPDYTLTPTEGSDVYFISAIIEAIVFEGLQNNESSRTYPVISKAVNCILLFIHEQTVIELLSKEQQYIKALFSLYLDSCLNETVRNEISQIFIAYVQTSERCRKHCANTLIEIAQRAPESSVEERTLPRFVSLLTENEPAFITSLSTQLEFRDTPKASKLLLPKP